MVSLATYTLFLLDARRQTFWEKLDDYLYYVRAFGNSVEFCFGILLFFNGAWILVFESGKLCFNYLTYTFKGFIIIHFVVKLKIFMSFAKFLCISKC